MNHNQSNTSRPAVVILGWLGCQPKHLRRYNEMYNRMGWQSLIRIGSPRSVIEAMAAGPSFSASGSSQSLQLHSEIMKDLAINTLRALHKIQPPYFVLHIFSNNGCFLWEWIRYLLFGQDATPLTASDALQMIDINHLRQRLIGITFDSSPAYYGGEADTLKGHIPSLHRALQYVSPASERNQLLNMSKSLDANAVRQRFDDFWNGMSNDATGIPQMYLYSQSDKLASAKHIEKLIAYREDHSLENDKKVWRHDFLDSEHCGHLLKYPEKYNEMMEQFLSFCTGKNGADLVENDISMRSRL